MLTTSPLGARGCRRDSYLMVALAQVFSAPLRWCTAVLCLAGTGLCALAAVLSFQRVGTAQAIVYIVVGIALLAAGFVVVKGYRWALWGALVVLGGDIAAVVGTAWELTHDIAEFKVAQLRQPGSRPPAGVTINLILFGLRISSFRVDHHPLERVSPHLTNRPADRPLPQGMP